MLNLRTSVASLILAVILTGTVQAKLLNLQEAPFSAKGDGEADDRPALARAFATAQPGDIIFAPPGSYRMILPGGPLAIPAGVTLLGQAGKSEFLLDTNGDSDDHREFLRPRSDVTIEGLTIKRATGFSSILIPVSGDASNITFRNCHIHGQKSRYPKTYCHAFRVGFGIVKNLVFDGVTVEECSYGLFQPNDAKGTLDGVTVKNCRFERNSASDLEFNSPQGVMRNIEVKDCIFRDNRCQNASGGFAVGFANVAGGSVENCLIQNYGSEALHVEDRATDINLVGNTITGGSLIQPNGVILVINNSKRVVIDGNFIDARRNENKPHLILVTAGGNNFAPPSEVSVTRNVLVNGAKTRTWYLQEGSAVPPEGNVIVAGQPSAEE